MGIKYIIIGLLFFVNPNINIVDILPDCIGCVFILYGLKELSDIAPGLNSARTDIKRLFMTELVKLALLITVPIITEAEKTFILLYVLVFGTLEAIFAIKAVTSLVDGMIYTASRHGGTAPFKKDSDTKTITAVFFIVKAALTALPELEYLQIGDTGVVDENAYSISSYKEIFIVINIFAVLVIGIIWFVMLRSYLRSAEKDSEFIEGARTYYDTEIKPKTDMFMMRSIKLMFVLLIIGAALTIDIYFDGELFRDLNILPDIISAAFLAAACIVAGRFVKIPTTAKLSLALFAVASLPLAVTTSYAAIEFGYISIYRVPEAYNLSIVSIILTFISAAAAAAFFIFMMPVLTGIVKKHAVTKYDFGNQLEEKNEYIISTLTTQIKAVCLLQPVIAVVSVLECVFRHLEIFAWWWMINALLTAVWAVCFARTLNNIRDRIELSSL